jgi:hypothetical protein
MLDFVSKFHRECELRIVDNERRHRSLFETVALAYLARATCHVVSRNERRHLFSF